MIRLSYDWLINENSSIEDVLLTFEFKKLDQLIAAANARLALRFPVGLRVIVKIEGGTVEGTVRSTYFPENLGFLLVHTKDQGNYQIHFTQVKDA